MKSMAGIMINYILPQSNEKNSCMKNIWLSEFQTTDNSTNKKWQSTTDHKVMKSATI